MFGQSPLDAAPTFVPILMLVFACGWMLVMWLRHHSAPPARSLAHVARDDVLGAMGSAAIIAGTDALITAEAGDFSLRESGGVFLTWMSLGLILALGDLGLQSWRHYRQRHRQAGD